MKKRTRTTIRQGYGLADVVARLHGERIAKRREAKFVRNWYTQFTTREHELVYIRP